MKLGKARRSARITAMLRTSRGETRRQLPLWIERGIPARVEQTDFSRVAARNEGLPVGGAK